MISGKIFQIFMLKHGKNKKRINQAPAEHRDMMFDSTIFSTFVKFFWK